MEKPLVTIGLPILNGEDFIDRRMESILSQTFSNFQVIISNNASNDNTRLICEKYAKKDPRIKIFNQKETIIGEKNFAFVLEQAQTKYFVWAAVDDLWEETFLEKNFQVLENNSKLVCCSGKVERFGDQNDLKINQDDSFLKKIYKKFRMNFRPFYNLSFSGEYIEKASKCLKYNNMLFILGLFRTEIIKKCVINYPVHSSDLIMCLKVLEFGDVKIVDEVTWKFYAKGISSIGAWNNFKIKQLTFLEMVFPFYPLTIWCKNHFGWKFIFKNLRHFVWLNTIFGFTPLLLDIVRFRIKRKGKEFKRYKYKIN
jgi:glycosyltransferase involved in cell wall biosynthesis